MVDSLAVVGWLAEAVVGRYLVASQMEEAASGCLDELDVNCLLEEFADTHQETGEH